jgi:hypothetical protein
MWGHGGRVRQDGPDDVRLSVGLWKQLDNSFKRVYNKNNFTLSGTPTYTGIYFNFNTSQAAACINTTCGNFGSSSFTIEYVAYYTASSGVGSLYALLYKRDSLYAPGIQNVPGWAARHGAGQFWVQDTNPGGVSGDSLHTIGFSLPVTSSLVHMAYTVEKNGTQTTGSMYTNGVLTSTDKKTFIGTNLVDSSIPMQIATSTTGSIAMVRMYNKKLSSTEVQQNFNALKGRFGL